MEVFVFDWWWRSHHSLAHKGLRLFRFCIVTWKDERKPSIKYCMEREIDVVQKFTRIQSFGQNWWWADGLRVEHVRRIHHIAAQPQSPRVTVKIERNTRKVYWTDHLHVDVQRHLMEIKGQQERMRGKCSTRLSMQRNSEQDNGHSSDLDRRTSGTLQVKTVHKENGTQSLSWWC